MAILKTLMLKTFIIIIKKHQPHLMQDSKCVSSANIKKT
jgi:hypothetical protein